MEHILTFVIGSLALVATVFVAATFVSAALSEPSKNGHLSPKLAPAFRPRAFIGYIIVFPFLADLIYPHYSKGEFTDLFLINAVVICIIWNYTNSHKNKTTAETEKPDGD